MLFYPNAVLGITNIQKNESVSTQLIRADGAGVDFNSLRNAILSVELNTLIVSRIISVSVPTGKGKTNVNQIRVAFFDVNGQIILNATGAPWVIDTTPGVTIVCSRFQIFM